MRNPSLPSLSIPLCIPLPHLTFCKFLHALNCAHAVRQGFLAKLRTSSPVTVTTLCHAFTHCAACCLLAVLEKPSTLSFVCVGSQYLLFHCLLSHWLRAIHPPGELPSCMPAISYPLLMPRCCAKLGYSSASRLLWVSTASLQVASHRIQGSRARSTAGAGPRLWKRSEKEGISC